jgi:hypothetical protein
MLRDDAVALIKQRMANNNNTALDALIVTEMKFQQELLEQEPELPWFLILEETAAGAADNAVPAAFAATRGGTSVDFLMEYEESSLGFYLDSNGATKKIYLKKDSALPLWNAYGDTSAASATTNPAWYAPELGSGLLGRYRIFPKPAAAYTVIMQAYYSDVPLATNITNQWLTYVPDLLIAKTGLVIAGQYEVMEKAVAQWQAQENAARARIAAKNVLFDEQNIRRLMGDS